jgi:hypothetical protein
MKLQLGEGISSGDLWYSKVTTDGDDVMYAFLKKLEGFLMSSSQGSDN